MNTPTIMWLVIASLLYVVGIYVAVKNYFKEKDPSLKKVHLLIIAVLLLVGAFLTVISLNAYGYLRTPILNQVTRTMPEGYTPNTGLAKPPSAGSIQPPSQPAIDIHKEQMDKLKREGL